MLNDVELLKLIMDRNLGQPASYILEQFALYKAGIAEVNAKLSSEPMGTFDFQDMTKSLDSHSPEEGKKPSLTCGYTKRNLKVKPEAAITDIAIACCICGQTFKTLTTRHLITHNGLTKEGYLKLCGYDPTTPLMSRQHYKNMVKTIAKAQNSRKAKLALKKA